MDLLDRLIEHDDWTTRQVLARCEELSEAQLDQTFPYEHGSVRATLEHMIGNIEIWTELIGDRPLSDADRGTSLAALEGRHADAFTAFGALARQVRDDGRLNGLWTDRLDNPPRQKTYAGAILHVILHDMHHRAQLLLMLDQLGLTNLPEGDLLGWEMTQHPPAAEGISG